MAILAPFALDEMTEEEESNGELKLLKRAVNACHIFLKDSGT